VARRARPRHRRASAADPESLRARALASSTSRSRARTASAAARAGASLHGTPLLALSPTFFAGVAANGSVAQRLGVAEVLATPVRRDDLIAAVRRLVPVAA
jgi:hypothetical protein